MARRPTVLVIDDEVRSLQTVRRVLNSEFDVLIAENTAEAEQKLSEEIVTVILCDQKMPGMTGVEFLKMVRERWPDPVRMILSGYTDAEDIIAGVNDAGIFQYITKPWAPETLLKIVRSAAHLYDLQRQNQSVSVEMKLSGVALEKMIARKKAVLKGASGFERILRTQDSPLSQVCETAMKVAVHDLPVLITGESGTGKELLARAIHYGSERAEQIFLAENCGALPDELLESELFGSKKGAYTGAYEDRVGLFEQADGGTIFLDEIGDTSPSFQVKLLRVLQENEVRALGAKIRKQINVRVIAATNKNLAQEVLAGRFRRDLYYRLAGFELHLPPLRDRSMDIPLLVHKLLADAQTRLGVSIEGIEEEAMSALRRYSWPGNVRELQNMIQRMVVLSEGQVISAGILPDLMERAADQNEEGGDLSFATQSGNLKDRVEKLEGLIISATLQKHHGNISRVADELGLSRVGLRGKMDRYGLSKHPE